jgi:hypothetical protein
MCPIDPRQLNSIADMGFEASIFVWLLDHQRYWVSVLD